MRRWIVIVLVVIVLVAGYLAVFRFGVFNRESIARQPTQNADLEGVVRTLIGANAVSMQSNASSSFNGTGCEAWRFLGGTISGACPQPEQGIEIGVVAKNATVERSARDAGVIGFAFATSYASDASASKAFSWLSERFSGNESVSTGTNLTTITGLPYSADSAFYARTIFPVDGALGSSYVILVRRASVVYGLRSVGMGSDGVPDVTAITTTPAQTP